MRTGGNVFMEYVFEYTGNEERDTIIQKNRNLFLIAEKNIASGNFLVFSDIKPLTVQIAELEQNNKLLEAKNQALADRADFIEDVVAEMATKVYQ